MMAKHFANVVVAFITFWPNVKEHATLSAGASVDHGVDVENTGDHVNRAADRGCCVSTCWASLNRLLRFHSPVPLIGLRIH
jgi:hypothetical protein